MVMAANAFNTYEQIGIKEQVSNIINNISPSETPFYSMVKKIPITNRLYQWQTDALAIPAANAQLEGDVVTVQASSATTMLQNRTQISFKSLSVTDTAQAVQTYGRGDEYDYQVMKRGKELKTDIEFALLRNTTQSVGGTTTARTCGGFLTYITNTINSTVQSSGNGTSALSIGASTALTYGVISSAMTMAYTAGGAPQYLMTTPVLKQKFSGLAFSATPSTADVRYNISSDKPATAIGAVERWLSDFGTVDVLVNRVMARQTGDSVLSSSVFLIDPKYVRMGFLQDIQVIPLSKRGLADEAFIRAEYTLEVGAPSSHAVIIGQT
jgi:hypothetical protein